MLDCPADGIVFIYTDEINRVSAFEKQLTKTLFDGQFLLTQSELCGIDLKIKNRNKIQGVGFESQ